MSSVPVTVDREHIDSISKPSLSFSNEMIQDNIRKSHNSKEVIINVNGRSRPNSSKIDNIQNESPLPVIIHHQVNETQTFKNNPISSQRLMVKTDTQHLPHKSFSNRQLFKSSESRKSIVISKKHTPSEVPSTSNHQYNLKSSTHGA